MQIDFHYYATYCAAYLAGFSHEECMEICSSAQFTDCCSVTLLSGIGAPLSAATTQLQLEIMDAKADILSLQDITRIWASFHFLPRDLRGCARRIRDIQEQVQADLRSRQRPSCRHGGSGKR